MKADAKGRVAVPSAFRKQFVSDGAVRFVIRKDIYQNCLVLYPEAEWNRKVDELRKRLNDYNRAHKKFKTQFFRGTAELEMDGNGRVLLPKRLMDMVGISKDIVMVGVDQEIQVWCREVYDGGGMDGDEFGDLAEEILGDVDFGEGD